jgi:DnaK suppressor protein
LKKKYSAKELKEFKENILEKIYEVNDQIESVRSTTNNSRKIFMEDNGEDYDEGTESSEVEKSFLLMSRESDYLVNLKKALQRIEDGSYGICEIYEEDPNECQCLEKPLISKERLIEVPNATKGVLCKEKKNLNLI